MDRLFALLDRYFEKILVRILIKWLESKVKPTTRKILSVTLNPVEGRPMDVRAVFGADAINSADGVVSVRLSYVIDGVSTDIDFLPDAPLEIVVPLLSVVTVSGPFDVDAAGNVSTPGPDFTFTADVAVPDVTAPSSRSINGVTLSLVTA